MARPGLQNGFKKCLDVEPDGFIGPVTLAAAASADAQALSAKLLARRACFYRNIGKGRKSKFLKGWLNRNAALASWAQNDLT